VPAFDAAPINSGPLPEAPTGPEKGYFLARFALENVTKKELDARRRETAERVESHRQSRGNEAQDGARNVARNAPGNALQGPSLSSLQTPLQGGGVLNSLSLDLRSKSEISTLPLPRTRWRPIEADRCNLEAFAGGDPLG
jgi:hypothetical protein